MPGTTEVLESCFGKLKGLEDGQSKSGFTGLVLSLGAIVSKRSIETIGEALSDVGLGTSGTGAERSWEYRFNPCENRLTPRQNAQQIPDDREVGTRPSFHHVSLALVYRHEAAPIPAGDGIPRSLFRVAGSSPPFRSTRINPKIAPARRFLAGRLLR